MTPLLEFTFDFLQKSHGKIVDASKFDIQNFEPDQSDNAEKETQWLLIHLYYLCLRHLANMTKNWWIDTKKRIKSPVESWTEKHVSEAEPQFTPARQKIGISNRCSRSPRSCLAIPFKVLNTGSPHKIPTRSEH